MTISKEMFDDFKSSFVAELRSMMLYALNDEILDPVFLLHQDAAREGAEFIKNHLSTSLLFRGSDPTWRFWPYVLGRAQLDGYFLEFGVFKGQSLSFFASCRPDRLFYGFDSFEGNPEDWYGSPCPKGFYGLNGAERPCTDIANIQLIEGWFEDTLPRFITKQLRNGPPCSFIHMDSNVYSSSVYVAQELAPYITTGTVIVYDDFLNYPGYKLHEFKAFFEELAPKFDYEFIAFQDMRAALIIK